jgi:hypothetical protein
VISGIVCAVASADGTVETSATHRETIKRKTRPIWVTEVSIQYAGQRQVHYAQMDQCQG